MLDIILKIADFLIIPSVRWTTYFLTLILSLLQYLNQPQRFSYTLSFLGISYKWTLYLISIYGGFTSILLFISIWMQIPFKTILPDYWYLYLFVLNLAIITQITLDSEQFADDGSFKPPPSYMMPQQYRVILSYATIIMDFLTLVQLYIYFGVYDITKKTAFSKYILERFGGWRPGRKLDFIFDWLALVSVLINTYLLLLQTNFQACEYGLPLSWNA